jgi:Fe-S cluster biogenesis protein NfuA
LREGDIERIKAIIAEEKPRFTQFGGDIEFMDVMDGKVRIRPVGHCYR